VAVLHPSAQTTRITHVVEKFQYQHGELYMVNRIGNMTDSHSVDEQASPQATPSTDISQSKHYFTRQENQFRKQRRGKSTSPVNTSWLQGAQLCLWNILCAQVLVVYGYTFKICRHFFKKQGRVTSLWYTLYINPL